MKTVSLGIQGLSVSAQGLGCMGMSTTYGPADEHESSATLARAVELGVTFYDTAESYGSGQNEVLIGKGLKDNRDKVVISTKVGFQYTDDGKLAVVDGKPVVSGKPSLIQKAVEGSLRRLDTDYVDLISLHRIDPDTPIEDTIGLLGELVKEGKARFIGVSEASPETIRKAHATHPLTMLQTEYSLFERGVEHNGVLDAARELGIGFVAYSPLGRGFLTGGLRNLDNLADTDFRRTDPRFQGDNLKANIDLVDRVTRIAKEKGVTPAQLALAWLMRTGAVPIPGTTKVKNLEQNVAAADIALTDADVAAINEAVPAGAASGDRYGPGMMDQLTR